jgi:hypothetical protein
MSSRRVRGTSSMRVWRCTDGAVSARAQLPGGFAADTLNVSPVESCPVGCSVVELCMHAQHVFAVDPLGTGGCRCQRGVRLTIGIVLCVAVLCCAVLCCAVLCC